MVQSHNDHVWDTEECLLKLIARDLPVVAPFMLKRSPPFVPVAFASQHEDGYAPVRWDAFPEDGPRDLVPVHACGSGGMLIQQLGLGSDGGAPGAQPLL